MKIFNKIYFLYYKHLHNYIFLIYKYVKYFIEHFTELLSEYFTEPLAEPRAKHIRKTHSKGHILFVLQLYETFG